MRGALKGADHASLAHLDENTQYVVECQNFAFIFRAHWVVAKNLVGVSIVISVLDADAESDS